MGLHHRQAEATEWTSAWTTFGTSREGLGLPPGPALLHPPDRRRRSATWQDVEVNFDGITYAKGASVLKQLVAYVGP